MTQHFISTIIYSSCLIYIFMKININIRTRRKIAEKIIGYTYKTTNIAAANCPRVASIMLNSSLCIILLPSGKKKELSNLYKININKNLNNTRKNVHKLIAVYLQNCSYLSCYKFYTFPLTKKNLGLYCFIWYQVCYYRTIES